MSQTKFHHIRTTKSKVIPVQIPVPKWEKTKKWENFPGLQNGAMRGLQIGTGFREYKSGQEGLQIRAALRISNWGKEITNRGKEISNRGRDYKWGQEGFQIGAGITNRCRATFIIINLQQNFSY